MCPTLKIPNERTASHLDQICILGKILPNRFLKKCTPKGTRGHDRLGKP